MMERYDFDRVIDRRGTNSLKYDFAVERGHAPDVLPLWVADMDFSAPQPVLDALQQAVAHGIFGYSEVKDDYAHTVAGWFSRHFGWAPEPDWLVKTPGVVFALALAIRALTAPGDGVLIQPPVYYPFFSVVKDNGRRLICNELRYENGRYEMDFEDLEEKLQREQVRLMILCSPHNPVGRVWTTAELQRLGALCAQYGIYVVSDEIHCDFTLPGHRHIPFLLAYPQLDARTIVCTAPSKSFNLAGLQVSNIWIPDPEVRRRFNAVLDASGYSQLNTLGLIAARSAYEHGGPWLDQCRAYLLENLSFLRQFLRERLPEIHLVEPDGTYFAWLDCSGLGLSRTELQELVESKARLWLDPGHIFSPHAAQFQRIVLACARETLRQALERLDVAVRAQ